MSSKGKSSVASSSFSTRPHPFILVVEDVPLHYRTTLRRITAVFNGAEVMHAKSYDEAMTTLGDQLAKKKMLPDLILSDCDLGRQLKHRPDLLKDLKNEKMYKNNIPVVMYSAAMDYEEELPKKLMSAGAEAALHKPLKFAEIKKWEKFFDVEGLVVPDN